MLCRSCSQAGSRKLGRGQQSVRYCSHMLFARAGVIVAGATCRCPARQAIRSQQCTFAAPRSEGTAGGQHCRTPWPSSPLKLHDRLAAHLLWDWRGPNCSCAAPAAAVGCAAPCPAQTLPLPASGQPAARPPAPEPSRLATLCAHRRLPAVGHQMQPIKPRHHRHPTWRQQAAPAVLCTWSHDAGAPTMQLSRGSQAGAWHLWFSGALLLHIAQGSCMASHQMCKVRLLQPDSSRASSAPVQAGHLPPRSAACQSPAR